MKPMASGSVLVRLPIAEVDADFAKSLDTFDAKTVVERTGEGHYVATTKAGLGRVVQEFVLERAELDETAVHATIWVHPAFLGWLARRLLGRRRLQRGVDAALQRMARAAVGEPEFGPEDFAEDGDFHSDAPPH